MYNIISKINSTFDRTIGKATSDKLTETVDGETQAFALISVKNILACRSTSAKFGHFFAFRKVFLPSLWMKLYSYWTSCRGSFIWLPLFVDFRSKQWTVFLHAVFCIFNIRRLPRFVCLVYSLESFKYCIWILFSYFRTVEKRTKWALI